MLELTRGDKKGPLTEQLDVLATLAAQEPGALDGSKAQTQYREMLLQGILGIAEGENPMNIELRLRGYLE